MRTVYAVTRGEYSSYHVDCLFETRELAQDYIAALHRTMRLVDERGDYIRDDVNDRVEELQLWDSVPVVGYSERWNAVEHQEADGSWGWEGMEVIE